MYRKLFCSWQQKEPANGFLSIFFGTSIETSDFIVECLGQWWEENKGRHSLIKELVINLDNGPHINSSFVEKAPEWAGTMTWNGVRPVVHLLDAVYQKGVKLTKEAMKIYEDMIERSETLPLWDVTIKPAFG